MFLAIGTNVFGQSVPKTAKSPTNFIPAGYVVSEEIQGDLNKDNQADYVFIIKGTDRKKVIKHEYLGELDRNRRGIIIALTNNKQYDLVLENRGCFSSENEDGGVYFAPELTISINKGNLLVHYSYGRYGYWVYNFRYQNSDFELIGYDNSQNRGAIVERSTSINFMTRRMLTRENINQNAKGGDDKFKEVWKNFTLSKLIKLREVADFDDLYVESFFRLVK